MRFALAAACLLASGMLAGCSDQAADPVDDYVPPSTLAGPGFATDGQLFRLNATGILTPVELPADTPFHFPVGAGRSTGHQSFEPTLGVHPDGEIFFSTFEFVPPLSYALLVRSADGGQNWTDVTPRAGPTSFPPQSNDPFVYVDDTGRIFLSDLQALVCSTLSFSDDKGESWTTNPVGCGQPFGVQDHQSVFTANPRLVTTVTYPKVVYYCINRVADTACATSLNGGVTFGALIPAYSMGGIPCDGLINGGLAAHGAAAPDGTVYLPRGNCAEANGPRLPTVAITKDDGLTWTHSTISDVPMRSGDHEVPVAVDEAGNVYAFWMTQGNLPMLSFSQDAGTTWSPAMMVAPPGVKQASFPTIAAGAEGRVALAFHGTASDVAPNDMTGEDTWDGYILTGLNVTTDPLWMAVTVNDPADPIVRGPCGAFRCDQDGTGDFNDIVIDANGRPWAAFEDVCRGACADEGGSENADHMALVGTLWQGPTLRGNLTALPVLPGVFGTGTA